MDFEEFEGFKRIPNKKHVRIQEIYEVLENYRENIGELSYLANLDDADILIDIEGKYDAKIYLTDNDIVIERIIEKGAFSDGSDSYDVGKSIPLAHADRVIEQIYDLLNDYLADGEITEHITKAQKVLKLVQDTDVTAYKAIPIGDRFFVSNYENEQEILYTIKQNTLLKNYSAINVNSKREEFAINYKRKDSSNFIIVKPPFERIEIAKDENSVKSLYFGKIKNKELKISADYSENHYLIELDEIVIGAIDCLDSSLKRNYRLEIHNPEYEYVIIAIAIISDYISFVEKRGILD